MSSSRRFCPLSFLIAAVALTLPATAQDTRKIAAIPADPLEMVHGPVEAVHALDQKQTTLDLLSKARANSNLRSSPQGYDLKVTFTVNSGGQTEYDGVWHMEDIFDPQHGLHWTANTSGYSITEIIADGKIYADSTLNYIPLRLQEARAALFTAIPAASNLQHAMLRTSNAGFQGTPLSCVLVSGGRGVAAASGRRWEETEECIDPESGLLKVHSIAPGRYDVYDYTNAPKLAGHVFPSTIRITEAGKTVSEITVDSLKPISDPDPSLFVPTQAMQDRGRAVSMGGAEKISRTATQGLFASGPPHTVCVFGLVTPSGQLVDAHSLQPSDPNSQAAVQAATQMNFTRSSPLGPTGAPQQHFVFIFENFGSSQ
jgi:hypothetical protein